MVIYCWCLLTFTNIGHPDLKPRNFQQGKHQFRGYHESGLSPTWVSSESLFQDESQGCFLYNCNVFESWSNIATPCLLWWVMRLITWLWFLLVVFWLVLLYWFWLWPLCWVCLVRLALLRESWTHPDTRSYPQSYDGIVELLEYELWSFCRFWFYPFWGAPFRDTPMFGTPNVDAGWR